MDYVKYALKSSQALSALLADCNHLFVIGCNKCFQERGADCEALVQFTALASKMGKHITGAVAVDFLCNSVQTEKKLWGHIPQETQCVAVISCGLGVQTVADRISQPVLAAANSLNYTGHHGMALTQKTCGACAQCYLNATGGICPVVDCSKGLLNGQCGGAKNGKCEIDPQKDCAWEAIGRRLARQGRTEEFLTQPVQLRDYSKPDAASLRAYVAQVRARRFEGFYGGVHPAEKKFFTAALPLQTFPVPETVVLPMSMHIGAPAVPLVQPGDRVKLGQCIGAQAGFISSPVHASVSGTVAAVEPRPLGAKGCALSIVIQNDGRDALHESVQPGKPLDELTPQEIVEIVREKGIVGMGGATFPTYVKLKPSKPIDAVLINGSECEPYLTADHRVMLEFAQEILFGLRAMMKAVGAPRGVILIADNKPDAIARMEQAAAPYDSIRICTARTQYPEGAEKMLIQKALGRSVPSGKLPADVGCVVCNASTAKAVSDAIQKGMPLVERAVTVTGECIRNPGNFLVRLGTPVQALLDRCGGIENPDAVLKIGGPMMGTAIVDTAVPIGKGCNGILATPADSFEAQPCIRCGRCMDVCPMELAPLNFVKYTEQGDARALRNSGILDCINCGCCRYICPSKVPFSEILPAAKAMALRGQK